MVGVVADARINGLKDAAAMVYVPYWENPLSTSAVPFWCGARSRVMPLFLKCAASSGASTRRWRFLC